MVPQKFSVGDIFLVECYRGKTRNTGTEMEPFNGHWLCINEVERNSCSACWRQEDNPGKEEPNLSSIYAQADNWQWQFQHMKDYIPKEGVPLFRLNQKGNILLSEDLPNI